MSKTSQKTNETHPTKKKIATLKFKTAAERIRQYFIKIYGDEKCRTKKTSKKEIKNALQNLKLKPITKQEDAT